MFCNNTYDGNDKILAHADGDIGYDISISQCASFINFKISPDISIYSTMDTALLSHVTHISMASTCGSHWTLKALMLK